MKAKVIELIKIATELGYDLNQEVNIVDNIIIPATAEEEHYYVLFDSTWYSINLETNEFSQNDFGKDYYEEYYDSSTKKEIETYEALRKYQDLLYEFDEVPSDDKWNLAMKAKEDYELIKKNNSNEGNN